MYMGKHFDSFESYSSALQTIVEHMYGMTRTSRPALEGRVPGTRWCGARFQCHRLTYDRHTGVQSALETGSPDNPLYLYMLHILLRLYCMIKGIYNHCSNQC